MKTYECNVISEVAFSIDTINKYTNECPCLSSVSLIGLQ